MTTTQTDVSSTATALDRARALARAIAESAEFRAFEAAAEALEEDGGLAQRLSSYQIHEQELRQSRAWGGADPQEVRALELEWEDLATHPILARQLAARDALLRLMREISSAISEGAGLDYGAACAPAGGCC